MPSESSQRESGRSVCALRDAIEGAGEHTAVLLLLQQIVSNSGSAAPGSNATYGDGAHHARGGLDVEEAGLADGRGEADGLEGADGLEADGTRGKHGGRRRAGLRSGEGRIGSRLWMRGREG